jgi:hypothetical protein
LRRFVCKRCDPNHNTVIAREQAPRDLLTYSEKTRPSVLRFNRCLSILFRRQNVQHFRVTIVTGVNTITLRMDSDNLCGDGFGLSLPSQSGVSPLTCGAEPLGGLRSARSVA